MQVRRRTAAGGRPSRAAVAARRAAEAASESGAELDAGPVDTSWKEPPPVAGEAPLLAGDGDEAHTLKVDELPPTRREQAAEAAQRAMARRAVPARPPPRQALPVGELPEAPPETDYPDAPDGETPAWLENNQSPAARKAMKQNATVPPWANAYKSGPPRVRVKTTPGEQIASKRANLIAQLREELAALERT